MPRDLDGPLGGFANAAVVEMVGDPELLDRFGPPLLIFDQRGLVHRTTSAMRDVLGLSVAPWTGSLAGLLATARALSPASLGRLLALCIPAPVKPQGIPADLLLPFQAHVTPLRDGSFALCLTPVSAPFSRDSLTDLPDRAALRERLVREMAGPVRGGLKLALLLLELDRGAAIEDKAGPALGDALLRAVAGRLRGSVRPEDLVARLDGDEFAVLVQGPANLAAVRGMAARLVELLQRPYVLHGQDVMPGVSIGIALHPDHGPTPEGLMCAAGRALDKAKQAGIGCHQVAA